MIGQLSISRQVLAILAMLGLGALVLFGGADELAGSAGGAPAPGPAGDVAAAPPAGAAGGIAEAPAPRPAGAAAPRIYLDPPSVARAVGETFAVALKVDTAGVTVDTVQACLDFDPAVLEVVDASGRPSNGIEVNNTLFDFVMSTSASNSTGQINFAASQTESPYLSGSFTAATIRFRTKAAGSTGLSFVRGGGARTSVLAQAGQNLDATTTNGAVVVGGGAAPAPTTTVVRTATPIPPTAAPTALPPIATATPRATTPPPTATPPRVATPALPGIPGTPLVVGPPAAPAPSGGLYFPETGYRVSRPAFQDLFEKRGGVRTFGYPVSREFTLLGFPVQFFQRGVLQRMPDGSVARMNLLDEGLMPYTRINFSTFPPPDSALIATAPSPADPDYGEKAIAFLQANVPDEWEGMAVGFLSTFLSTVRYEDAFPRGEGDPGLVPLLNLEVWGLPTSRPAYDPGNQGFVYQRFQRGILHYDASTGATQGLLLADYLKSIITGENLPPDLEEQARDSRFYRQYDRGAAEQLARPGELPGSDLAGAFQKEGP